VIVFFLAKYGTTVLWYGFFDLSDKIDQFIILDMVLLLQKLGKQLKEIK
jgi:hypothetical protein